MTERAWAAPRMAVLHTVRPRQRCGRAARAGPHAGVLETANCLCVRERLCARLRAPDGPTATRAQAKAADAGEPWVAALAGDEYGALPLGERVRALARLAHLALDGPLVRACQDARLDEAARVRKLMWDESKARASPRADALRAVACGAAGRAALQPAMRAVPGSRAAAPCDQPRAAEGRAQGSSPCARRMVLRRRVGHETLHVMRGAQADSKQKQVEAADRARRAAEEAERALSRFRAQQAGEDPMDEDEPDGPSAQQARLRDKDSDQLCGALPAAPSARRALEPGCCAAWAAARGRAAPTVT